MRNIVNHQEIEEYLSSIKATGKVLQWVRTVLRRHLYRKAPITTTTIDNPPHYATHIAHRIIIPKEEIQTSIKYLEYMQTHKEAVQIQYTDYWTTVLKAKRHFSFISSRNNGFSGVTVLKRYPDYFWCKLLSYKAYKYEGASLGHCIGGVYYQHHTEGKLDILSLRDHQGRPRLSLLIKDNITDIRCKGNTFPSPKYYPYIADIIFSREYGDWNAHGCPDFHQYITDEFFRRLQNTLPIKIEVPRANNNYRSAILRGISHLYFLPGAETIREHMMRNDIQSLLADI